MVLHILAHNLKYRVVHFSYCRSKQTISQQFNNVLRAVMKVSQDYLKFCYIVDMSLSGMTSVGNDMHNYIDFSIIDLFLFVFKAHKEARQFRFKVIVNWDDIVDLCAKDRATGHGAETAMDADEVMSREINEGELSLEGASDTIYLDEPGFTTQRRGQSSASTSTQSQRRKTGEKDGIANSLKEVAESLKRLVQAFDITIDEDAFIQEVLAEAALIPNLNQHQWAKAVKWLSDTPKQLAIVKALPIEKKAAYVLTHIS
uniref:Uncharacterized protein n=1 Tax=Cajanus cajan TaxID=3821 RepID=A0A151RF41_CAJCA|nr:hypothetical protein KK1_037370 [Cajanus cajan]